MNQVGERVANGKSILLKRQSCSATAIPSSDLPSLRIQPAEKPAAHQTQSNDSNSGVVLVSYVVDHFFSNLLSIDSRLLCTEPFHSP
jgi:hypothetical protein